MKHREKSIKTRILDGSSRSTNFFIEEINSLSVEAIEVKSYKKNIHVGIYDKIKNSKSTALSDNTYCNNFYN